MDEDIISLLGGYIVYGQVQNYHIWTSVGRRKEGPLIYNKIGICLDVYDNVHRVICIEPEDLVRFNEKFKNIFAKIGQVNISPRESIEGAINKANKINKFSLSEEAYEHTITLKLVSNQDKPYKGDEIWDVMLCLGIEWGDMDIFHAQNESAEGDDHLFSVSTSTNPGFFWLPTIREDVFRDLVFTMNIARTVAPLEVFDAMWNAAAYSKKRLSGTFYDENNAQVMKNYYIKIINDTQKRFLQWGFATGSEVALYLF